MIYKFFERLTCAFPPFLSESPPNTLFGFCRYYTKGFVKPLIVMSILTGLIAITEVTLFGFMGQLVDWLTEQDPETFLEKEKVTLIGMSILVLFVIPLLVACHSLLMHQSLLTNYPMSIRWLAHRYLLKQSIGFYQNDFAGRIATKVMQTALSVRETVMKLLDVAVYIFVYFISMLLMLGQADIRLVIPMLVWLVVYLCLQVYFVPKLKNVSTEQADARSLMTGRIVDSYTNITTVKLFSHTDRETDYAQQGMDTFLDTVYRQMRLATGFNISVEIINYMLVFSIASISIWLWIDSAISVGAIAIAVSLALRINGMSKWIMWEIGSLFENIGTVIDGMRMLSKPIEVTDKPDAPSLDITHGEIVFENVRFHYGEQQKIIENLNLTIKPGEKVGLVGRSGAGKSTLVNLLMRFHDVEGGAIRIDGQDISAVAQDSLRANIGMVTQDTSLLHRSIRDNILYGDPDASEEAMLQASQRAHADDFISTLTDPHGNSGYDSQVGERGVKLSGGQRQRVAIARVLLKNAPILLLDEATSALDSEVESAIQESLYQLMEGKTVIAIAHRLSTIAAMDRLIVLDKGDVVEQGTHFELIAKGGIYAQLWKHQTGGFIGD